MSVPSSLRLLRAQAAPDTEATRIRQEVAAYCLRQAKLEKPYNVNLLYSATEDAFYCSQLAYAAYHRQGINLKTGKGIPRIPGTGSVVFPQEIWSGCTRVGSRVGSGLELCNLP